MGVSLIRYFLAQRAGNGVLPVDVGNPGTFLTLRMGSATGNQTVHLPEENNQRGDVCAVRVVNPSALYSVAVQSPPGVTMDTFLPAVAGTRSYIFDGVVFRPFGASVS
jgi:hypothetical protein